eukprot:s1099_g25.t1
MQMVGPDIWHTPRLSQALAGRRDNESCDAFEKGVKNLRWKHPLFRNLAFRQAFCTLAEINCTFAWARYFQLHNLFPSESTIVFAMEPANPSDLLALRSCSGIAPDMQQAIQLLSRGGNVGRSNPGVAECLMRIKEIDAQAQVEQCKLSESGMTERQRIQRSKRFDCLAEVIQASVREGAVTTRQAISARAEVSKQTIKGNVQIEESRLKAQNSSNLWQWVQSPFDIYL